MNIKSYILGFILILFCGILYSQNRSAGFYHLQSVNGEVKAQGLFREQKSTIGDIREDQKSLYFIGGIMINTSNYLWNPDVIDFNLNVEYNPESRNENYLLVPDRSEVRTLKRLDFNTTIFRNKSVSLNSFVNLNQTYFNRELLTNIKTDNSQWGGIFSLNNKILPASISFRQVAWDQKELQTGRVFSMDQNNILGRISKSFGNDDSNELIYSRDDYTYKYAGSYEVSNLINKVALNDNFYFDRDRKYNLNSQLSYYDQEGDNPFRRLEAIERIMFELPANLRLFGGYTYYRIDDPFQLLSQNRISGSINHRLFESLTTNIFSDYSGITQTIYDENNLRGGIDLDYTKKIGSGRLNLSYRYFRSNFDMKGVSAPVRILNEEHILSDSKITILNKPSVDIATIVIKDASEIVVYQVNFDYTITVVNNYVQIQRVPGGQIADNQTIIAEYTATQPGSYSYKADNNSYSVSIQFFRKLVELYYRGSHQDYHDLEQTEFITLDYFNQNVYGVRFDVGFAGFGAEYDNYQSNIIPYIRYRYFIDLNKTIRSKLIISANGNIMDYTMLAGNVDQQHINITGKIAYNFTLRTKADIEGGYLRQRGKNIDLDLFTSRLGISTSFRQLHLKYGIDMYSRQYLNSDFTFFGTFIELVRKF